MNFEFVVFGKQKPSARVLGRTDFGAQTRREAVRSMAERSQEPTTQRGELFYLNQILINSREALSPIPFNYFIRKLFEKLSN
jgi:hypothetical protein